ncbi:MAG: endonuclease/exonuclease/phosphatase family protein [Planctomycetes bacterium]|nr:endonuclease/exonuclease/phosphatase family protein [Planctomycetota bacterium]
MVKFGIRAAMSAVMAAGCLCAVSCKDSQQTPPPPDPEPNKTLKVLCWNVRMNETDGKARLASLLKIIGSADADIIALQGVWPQMLDAMVKEPWAAGYQKFKDEDKPVATSPTGLIVWAKFKMVLKIRFEPDWPNDRPPPLALAAKMAVNSRGLVIVNTKLEPKLDKAAARKKQLSSLYSLFEEAKANDVLLVGDLGFGDGQPEQETVEKNLTDVWPALRPSEKGFTWDMEANGLAKKYAYHGETSRRIDRVFVGSNYWTPQDVQLVGTEPITPGDASMFPSDHFGLLVTFKKDPRPVPAPDGPASIPASGAASKPAPQPAHGR